MIHVRDTRCKHANKQQLVVIGLRRRKRGTKALNLSRNIVLSQVLGDVCRFSPSVINLTRNKNICCGLKKVVAKSRARVYFEQQSLVLLLVFSSNSQLVAQQICSCLSQPISTLHFFNPQQMFLLRVKLITPGEKRETSTKTCNETMLRDKLRVFVSRISPPLCVCLTNFLARENKKDGCLEASKEN